MRRGALQAVIVASVVHLDQDAAGTLATQLRAAVGGGLCIRTWSHLPQGSGLGTSSILAAALLDALACISGRGQWDRRELVHRVLVLEQLLTTGGGWQDQVGGIYGGVKRCRSAPGLPLQVDTDALTPAPPFTRELEKHLVLVYTGTTRLARDLLQSVLRRWGLQEPATVATIRALRDNAHACAAAIGNGDVATLGRCVSTYWEQKKALAGTACEPPHVTAIMDLLRPHVWGQALAGAGGGGFLFAITKRPDAAAELEALVRSAPALAEVTFHRVEIDTDGLCTIPI
eukprot:Unigene13194_Nuclearia_a/m.39958 Unigene13194_Nuclearia_a/g.39958  ORF Unigene13194_Nuclearia_a/g.39958 Unigene13194_Nuclearia_a/m.39958 type:complete len:287 (+) Unigene13194_Nuclearia_a:1117-1977(+)